MPTLEQMKIRQRVLADFGELALRSDNLDDVLHEACRLVSDALGADLAKILEIEEGGEAALVKAGGGWRSGIVGKKRLQLSERTSETYSLKLGEPVISRDIREEDRFDSADFLIEHDAVSLVNEHAARGAILSPFSLVDTGLHSGYLMVTMPQSGAVYPKCLPAHRCSATMNWIAR